MGTLTRFELAAIAALDAAHNPTDPGVLAVVEDAWHAIGCDYLSTLRAAIAERDRWAGQPTDITRARFMVAAVAQLAAARISGHA